MQEMSVAGAKVLNAQAVQFAKEKQIAIYARSTFDRNRETVVRRFAPGEVVGVQAVVSEKEIIRVRIRGSRVLSDFNRALEILENEQVPVKEVHVTRTRGNTGSPRAAFVVSSTNIYGWEAIQANLAEELGANVAFDDHLGALSLIGEGLNRTNETLIEAIELLHNNAIEVFGISTTSFRISLLVPRESVAAGVRLCHANWIVENG
jgi:aspartate kinase